MKYINYAYAENTTSTGLGQKPYNGNFDTALYSYGAFENCSALTSINLKSATSLVGIGNRAFVGCSNLNDYTGGNQIEVYTYDGTTLVLKETISNGVLDLRCDNGGSKSTGNLVSIGVSAFAQNAKIRNIILPNSIKTIGDEAFLTNNLGTIYCEWKTGSNTAGTGSIGSKAFNYNSNSVHTLVYFVNNRTDVDSTNNNINYWTYYINDDKTVDRNKIVTFGTNGDVAKAYIAKLS